MTVTTPGGPADPVEQPEDDQSTGRGSGEPIPPSGSDDAVATVTTAPTYDAATMAGEVVPATATRPGGEGPDRAEVGPARTPAAGGLAGGGPWWQRPLAPLTPRRIAVAVAAWLVVSLVSVVLVLYGVGPMLEQRDQRALLQEYRTDIRQSADEELSLQVGGPETEAPDFGSPVAILDIGRLHFEQVVVEGVGPQQTRHGPGHVPGTAGLGQPGNSAVVARRSAFGGLFGDLGSLRRGTEILVTTTQGQSVYEVVTVRTARLRTDEEAVTSYTDATSTTTSAPERALEDEEGREPSSERSTTTTTAPAEPALPRGALSTEDVYGPSEDDRLTLVTSASRAPWATDRATVVVARMRDRPFEPTPQNGRTQDDDGRSSDPSAWAPLLLAGLAYLVAVAAAVMLYRRARPRSAYLLTAPPLLAAVVLTAETVARLLPAWF